MARVFSGIQPTGDKHLGNLLGAIRHWVTAQDHDDALYCVVDLHAMTVPYDAQELADRTRSTAVLLLAAGLDPERCTLFVQSHVPGHTELTWILNCVATVGELRRMTQFKEKSAGQESVTAGLFDYPVLMAADILLYKATHVPVGEDQKQHLELARDLAGAFNRRYGVEYFPLPEPQIFGAATRVMSLRDGSKKMSKSDSSDYSRINMTDDAATVELKIRKAKTDPEPLPDSEAGLAVRPEAANLLGIYAALADTTLAAATARFAGRNFSAFKEELAATALAILGKIGGEMRRLVADPGYIDDVLRRGAARADAIAEPHLREVQEMVGLLRP